MVNNLSSGGLGVSSSEFNGKTLSPVEIILPGFGQTVYGVVEGTDNNITRIKFTLTPALEDSLSQFVYSSNSTGIKKTA
jgi:hypothetical protein